MHQETLRLLRDQLAAVASEARSREITRDHSRSLEITRRRLAQRRGLRSRPSLTASRPLPRRQSARSLLPAQVGRRLPMRPRRRGGGDGGESARRRPSASRAQEWRAARTSTPTARSRGRWRADWVACCLSDGRAPVARYHARGCDCEPLRRASCLLCGSFLSFHIRFGPVRSTTHERCEAQRREAESGRAEPRKRSVRLTREVARPRVSL